MLAGSIVTSLVVAGAVLGTASSAQADETFTPTCTMSINTAPFETFTYNPSLTLGVTAPDAAPPDAVITVTVNAHPEDLPTSDANPQLLVAYENLSTVYTVDGGTIVPGSEDVTSGATIKTFPITSHIVETPTSVAPVVDGPIPPGAFVPPAFTFQVHVDPAASAVTFTATQHEETADFDGPGAPQQGASTCPIDSQLASTTVDPNATTTSLASTTTASTSTTTSSSTSTTIGGTTTTTTIGNPPPAPVTIGDPSVVEPQPRQHTHIVFTLVRTDASTRVRVHFRTIDGTAIHGVDYGARDFSPAFPRGRLTISVNVTVKHNPAFTGGRWFLVQISDPGTGQVFGTAIATITES